MSGGTLLALAADEIVMDANAVLGSVDPQLNEPHDYALTSEELKELGLPVSTDMPADIYNFMELFPQPKQKVPSVQYLPVPARQGVGQGRQE
jgi:ClpP class serine protease